MKQNEDLSTDVLYGHNFNELIKLPVEEFLKKYITLTNVDPYDAEIELMQDGGDTTSVRGLMQMAKNKYKMTVEMVKANQDADVKNMQALEKGEKFLGPDNLGTIGMNEEAPYGMNREQLENYFYGADSFEHVAKALGISTDELHKQLNDRAHEEAEAYAAANQDPEQQGRDNELYDSIYGTAYNEAQYEMIEKAIAAVEEISKGAGIAHPLDERQMTVGQNALYMQYMQMEEGEFFQQMVDVFGYNDAEEAKNDFYYGIDTTDPASIEKTKQGMKTAVAKEMVAKLDNVSPHFLTPLSQDQVDAQPIQTGDQTFQKARDVMEEAQQLLNKFKTK